LLLDRSSYRKQLRYITAAQPNPRGSRARTVLIADDSEKVRQSLARMITCFSHLTVAAEATNGNEALALIRQFQPDIVVLDVEMPELSGLEVLAAIKSEDLKCMVIMFTGQADDAYRQKCLAMGAKHSFEKGTQVNEFLTALKQL